MVEDGELNINQIEQINCRALHITDSNYMPISTNKSSVKKFKEDDNRNSFITKNSDFSDMRSEISDGKRIDLDEDEENLFKYSNNGIYLSNKFKGEKTLKIKLLTFPTKSNFTVITILYSILKASYQKKTFYQRQEKSEICLIT